MYRELLYGFYMLGLSKELYRDVYRVLIKFLWGYVGIYAAILENIGEPHGE